LPGWGGIPGSGSYQGPGFSRAGKDVVEFRL